MSVIRELRRRGGALRNKILYSGRDRRLAEAAEAAKLGWVAQATDALPALPTPQTVLAEVHTLCGEAQSVMGFWASWSLMRFLPDARLVIHSDGSLTPETIARWKRLIPAARVIDQADSLAQLDELLADYPKVLEWTRKYHFGFKLGGLHALVETPKILDMDTDVLVMSKPDAVIEFFQDNTQKMAWNRDHQNCLAYPENLFRELFGPRLKTFPDRLNGGFMMCEKLGAQDWQFLEEVLSVLEADPRTDPLRFWMHQTLFSLLAATYETGTGPLPTDYDIYMGQTRPGSAVRHYVGNPGVRPRFFTEGIAAVIRDARMRGQLPKDFHIEDVPE